MKSVLVGFLLFVSLGCGSRGSSVATPDTPNNTVTPKQENKKEATQETKQEDPLVIAKMGATTEVRQSAITRIVLEVKDAGAATQVLRELSTDNDFAVRVAAIHALLCFDTTNIDTLIRPELSGLDFKWNPVEKRQVDSILVQKLAPLIKADIDTLPPLAKEPGKKKRTEDFPRLYYRLSYIRKMDFETYGPIMPELPRLLDHADFRTHIESFAQSGAPGLVPALVEALGSETPGIGIRVKTILQNNVSSASTQDIPKLTSLFASKHPDVRVQAAIYVHAAGVVDQSLPIILNHPWPLRQENGKFKGEFKATYLPPNLMHHAAKFSPESKNKAREIASGIVQSGGELAKKVAAEYLAGLAIAKQ